MSDWIETHLCRIVSQEEDGGQYIHLQERDGDRRFPIVIGPNEVREIQRKVLGQTAERPLTHDLIGNIIRGLDCTLNRVLIHELRDNTFFALLELEPEGSAESVQIDCRPSDAIAVAVQFGTPIFVARPVFEEVATIG